MWELQGERAARSSRRSSSTATQGRRASPAWEQVTPGAHDAGAVRPGVGDLVNYLQWMAEPAQNTRIRVGVWVLLFLGVLLVFVWRLNAAYWKDVQLTLRNAVRPRRARVLPGVGCHRDPTLFDFKEPFTMMVLYSGTTCPFSHRCRFVLFEKGMDFQIRDVDLYNKPEDIARDEPVQPGAGAGRARPDPVRVEHHQRVHRRALSASAADAGRPGDARPRAPVPAQLREGAVRARLRRSRTARPRATRRRSKRPARTSATG